MDGLSYCVAADAQGNVLSGHALQLRYEVEHLYNQIEATPKVPRDSLDHSTVLIGGEEGKVSNARNCDARISGSAHPLLSSSQELLLQPVHHRHKNQFVQAFHRSHSLVFAVDAQFQPHQRHVLVRCGNPLFLMDLPSS